jgi:hypothetical protein
MEVLTAILVFLGVIIVAALFFGGWVIVAIVRLLARALGGGRTYEPAPRLLPPSQQQQRLICAHGNCRADNAAAARFCRRCGRPVAGARGPMVRRVAMW